MKSLFAVLLASTLLGCAAVGPTESPEFPALVAEALPPDAGAVLLQGSGNWFPNVKGFTAVRSLMLSRPADPTPGVIVITETAVLFQQWDERSRKYDVVKRLKYTDVMSAEVDAFGAGRRLVLGKSDYSYETFEITRAQGNLIDGPGVEKAHRLVQMRLAPKSPQR